MTYKYLTYSDLQDYFDVCSEKVSHYNDILDDLELSSETESYELALSLRNKWSCVKARVSLELMRFDDVR